MFSGSICTAAAAGTADEITASGKAAAAAVTAAGVAVAAASTAFVCKSCTAWAKSFEADTTPSRLPEAEWCMLLDAAPEEYMLPMLESEEEGRNVSEKIACARSF
jgi:hypothetical protein